MRIVSLRKRRLALTGFLASACLLQSIELPLAATTTSTFTVSITLAATCTINSASTLNFGTQGVLSANVDQTSTIVVQSSGTSGPTYSPSTDAIGAMSQAPRHSNERTLKRGSSPAAESIAS